MTPSNDQSTSSRSAIVVVVDRLSAGFLGPYGNTWIETPNINRLASQSMLFENMIIDSSDPLDVYRSYWSGRYAADDRNVDSWLAQTLREAGIDCQFLTDAPELIDFKGAGSFTQRHWLETVDPTRAADEVESTQMARLFTSAIDLLDSLEQPSLFWIHSQAMAGPWDAPFEFRHQFADEEDPTPPDWVATPSRLLEPDHDPDEVLGLSHAYAGQIVLLDLCLGALLDRIDQLGGADQVLVILTSTRGFPLGEHLGVGAASNDLYGELVHVPLMIRNPDLEDRSVRRHSLVQPADLYASLLQWFGKNDLPAGSGSCPLWSWAFEPPPHWSRSCSWSGEQAAIRTPAWYYKRKGGNYELFVKPDDRWEINNVADRCPDVLPLLDRHLRDFQQACRTGDFEPLAPLEPELVQRQR